MKGAPQGGSYDYIIVGNGAAGTSALRSLRSVDQAGSAAVVSAEPWPAYNRVSLAVYVAGEKTREELFTTNRSFYEDMGADTLLGRPAVHWDPRERLITLDDGVVLRYGKILVASGASPVFPAVPGLDGEGVAGLRCLADADALKEWTRRSERAVILGGGLVSLQTAEALSGMGLGVDLVVSSPNLLSRLLLPQAAEVLEGRFRDLGLRIHTGRDAVEFHRGADGTLTGVTLSDGSLLPCQVAVVGKGTTPNLSFALESGLPADCGIVVNDRLAAEPGGAFAAGDAAMAPDFVTGVPSANATWLNAVEQGKTAGLNMAGADVRYLGGVGANFDEFCGLPLTSFGLTAPREKDPGYRVYEFFDPKIPVYRRLVFQIGDGAGQGCLPAGGVAGGGRHAASSTPVARVAGAVLLGEVGDAGVLYQFFRGRHSVDLPNDPADLPGARRGARVERDSGAGDPGPWLAGRRLGPHDLPAWRFR
ncbi:MAG: NAD(P)/FAD-dependent oxidoreductase [Firmicutes bacterium]|nr:NAD(P)/FAD-dependent oxidoreductase [Bacillota bacterium]